MAAATTTTNTMFATQGSALDGVYFVNPDAAQARSRRRVKLAEARARLAALAAGEGGVFSLGAAGGPGLSQKDVRKQQRMLRNRESAALSRKRKSDRIGELELQVEALQEENRRLRQRVDGGNEGGAVAGGSGVGSASPPSAPVSAPPSDAAATYLPPHRSTWAPINLAADAALSATSIIVPSASTTNVVPATPPAPGDAGDVFHFRPGASMVASGCSATSCSASSSAAAANACFNFISRPAAETTTAMQKQQQQQTQEQEEERQQQCQTRRIASAPSKTGPGSEGETEVSTDGEAGSSSSCSSSSSSSDSDEADADDAIDFLFAELMAEEAAPGGAASAGEQDGSSKGADQELLLYLSGVSGGQAPATNVIEMGAVRAI